MHEGLSEWMFQRESHEEHVTPVNRPEMRVRASNKAIVCYEMSHLDMYVHEQDS